MKNLIPLFLSLIFLMSCPKPKGTNDLFDGKWEMDSYSVFAPDQPDFSAGDVVWTFDSGNNKVKIENKLHDTFPYLKAPGTYDYSLGEEMKITVDGQTFDYRFEDGKLIMSDKPELDGPLFTFKKL